MVFVTTSTKDRSLKLNIKGVPITQTKSLIFFVIMLSHHLKWKDRCNNLVMQPNSKIFQLCKLSILSINRESLLLVSKSWIWPLLLYSNACCWTTPKRSSTKIKTFEIEHREFFSENEDGTELKNFMTKQRYTLQTNADPYSQRLY